jgi:hypothetical protein
LRIVALPSAINSPKIGKLGKPWSGYVAKVRFVRYIEDLGNPGSEAKEKE